MTIYNKRECLERAQNLLSKEDDSFLRYACLELRFCMEAITYEKLNSYSSYVPAKVFKKWQPAHALNVLLQFEPDADEGFTLYVSPESSPGVPTGNWSNLGEHRTFKLGWLKKNYNKLGSYLHMSQNNDNLKENINKTNKIRKELQTMSEELSRINDSDIISMTLATRITFQCQICNQISVVHEDVLRNENFAICINPHCGAEYQTEKDEDRWQFKLRQLSLNCINCNAKNWFEIKQLNVGTKFKCRKCSKTHQIIATELRYDLEKKYKGK